jgi:flagellar hook assembly protein FlgD
VTVISYQLATDSDVELNIYNNLGQKIVTLISERQSAGDHMVEWNASQLASGVYYYKLSAGNFTNIKKMILLR